MNILIINGHMKWEKFAEGTLNKSIESFLIQQLARHNIELSRVESDYDVAQEVQKWKNSDLIIYLFPVYWMSVPWKMKKYLEEVLMASGGILFANDGRSKSLPNSNYGNGGLSQNKKFMMIGTMNAPQEAFEDTNFFQGSFDSLMHWLIKNNHFLGIHQQLSSMVFYDVVKNPTIEAGFTQLKAILNQEVK